MNDAVTVIVLPDRELDIKSAPVAMRLVREQLVGQVGPSALLDMQHVEFIDSTGLGAIIGLRNDLEREGGTVHLSSLQPKVCRVIEIMGLGELIQR